MKMPQIRASKLASAMLAGGVALSVLLGPALLPPNTGGSAARADITIGISLFQSELSPYGRWVDSPSYGEVWYPVGVHSGWRPYYDDGHWVYSDDYGWLWVSDLPWGWAPFHYGRWVFDDDYGWVWVPGYVWGPAWVTFRSAPGYIGWAPLPPWAEWDDDYGFRRRYDVEDDRYWCFVRPEGFLAVRFDGYLYDRRDYPTIINRTTNITNITVINNHVVNRGIDVNHIERVTHEHVDHVVVSDSDRPDRTVLKGNRVVIYKPAVVDQGGNRIRRDTLQNTNQGAPQQFETNQQLRKKRGNQAPEFGQPEQTQPSFGTNEQPQVLRKKKRFNDQNQAPEFNQPEQMQPSFGANEQPQLLRKKKRNNQNQAPEFNQPEQMQPSFGTNEQPQVLRKKKRFNDQNQAPEFNQPEQMQPSFGTNEQPQTRKKQQQQQFAVPDNGGSFDGGQVIQKKNRNVEQFNNGNFGQQQPEQFQPQLQKKKKNTGQCSNGDPACGQ